MEFVCSLTWARLTVVVSTQADLQVEQSRQHFYELSLEYVCKLQEIQERKKFEFVEPVSNRASFAVGPCEQCGKIKGASYVTKGDTASESLGKHLHEWGPCLHSPG